MNPLDMTDIRNTDAVALSPRGKAVARRMQAQALAASCSEYRGRPGYPECARCGESSGHAEDCGSLQSDVDLRTLLQLQDPYRGLRAALARSSRTRGWLA